MFIKRFVVRSLPQAMDMIRAEMGKDAMILSSRKIRAKGIAGWFGKMEYEVVAAVDPVSDDTPDAGNTSKQTIAKPSIATPLPSVSRAQESVEDLAALIVRNEEAESPAKSGYATSASRPSAPVAATLAADSVAHTGAHPATSALDDALHTELREIRALLSTLVVDGSVTSKEVDSQVADVVERWTSTGLSRELLRKFWSDYIAPAKVESEAFAVGTVARRFALDVLEGAGPPRLLQRSDRVAAFFGPTGVGKTTTIAKLAALSKIRDGRQVGLLTIDTFRVGAIAQLRTYADILNVPMAIAQSADEVASQFGRLDECDLVLIDTTGRSFIDRNQVDELQDALSALPIDVKYLVLSLTMREVEALHVARALAAVSCDALLFTKWDEAILPALAMSLVNVLKKPLSYVATGQHVPDDLRDMDASWLADCMAGGGLVGRPS